jgi:hypothetical protein
VLSELFFPSTKSSVTSALRPKQYHYLLVTLFRRSSLRHHFGSSLPNWVATLGFVIPVWRNTGKVNKLVNVRTAKLLWRVHSSTNSSSSAAIDTQFLLHTIIALLLGYAENKLFGATILHFRRIYIYGTLRVTCVCPKRETNCACAVQVHEGLCTLKCM